MKKMYTTAMGKQIDFESLKAVGEETIAVGNMKVNARGDQLGPGGVIEKSRNSAIADHYRVTAETREEKIRRQQLAGVRTTKSRSTPRANTQETTDMEQENTQENSQVPQATQQNSEPFVPPDKKLRGSLADSMAREATVNQEKMPDPRKPKGPSRI